MACGGELTTFVTGLLAFYPLRFTGTRTGSIAVYDPFGDPINLTTGLIGTLTANTSTLSNSTTAGTSYGWEGEHGKQDQTTGDIATIEMGARQYVPILGRFLSVDPVPGGNSKGLRRVEVTL